MEFLEQWLPLINESISWVKEKVGPSKKDLKLKISDLENQVCKLAYGNEMLKENMGMILNIILRRLESEGSYTVNADTIVLIRDNQVHLELTDNKNNYYIQNQENSSIFSDLDAEITESRLTLPSERKH